MMGSGSGNMAMTRLARTADLTWSSSFTYQRMLMKMMTQRESREMKTSSRLIAEYNFQNQTSDGRDVQIHKARK